LTSQKSTVSLLWLFIKSHFPTLYFVDAFLCCHGDFQPNNILFRKSKNGQLTDKIAAIIDWQLIFGGNPFTDLVRFLVAAVDDNLRSQGADLQAFNVYYNELERLYAKVGQTPGFTREQVYYFQ
jgi:aminoglycoside phosphotransferase (APT) family kinase protein